MASVFTISLLDKVGGGRLCDGVDVYEPLCDGVRGYRGPDLDSFGQPGVTAPVPGTEILSRGHRLVDDQGGEEPRGEPGQCLGGELNDPTRVKNQYPSFHRLYSREIQGIRTKKNNIYTIIYLDIVTR